MASNKKQSHTILSLNKRIEELEAIVFKKEPEGKSLNKVETFNGEVEPEKEDKLHMNDEDKLQSAKNAVAILPPNLKVDGRHLSKNIAAICGFAVTSEMMDAIYQEG